MATRTQRRKAERLRAYGGTERIKFVRSMGCSICGWVTTQPRPGLEHPIENAHTRSGGTGRKADADTIIPLCWTHHDEYDGGKKTFAAKYSFDPIARAAEVESAWQEWGEAANP
mgnify:FL=1